jgi:eukaryotic-like serine/threonine-protein kinase
MNEPSERWTEIERIFAAAAQLPPEARAGYLNSVCGEDSELRGEVESLLAYDRPESSDLSRILAGAAASFLEGSSYIGRRFGAYLATSLLGTGGMGSVYLGVRADDQFQKQVAIKVIKHGLDTGVMVARFRHERQILANLDHPYIAKLLDGGVTGDGLPFLVMEHVEGKPIDAFCDAAGLGIRARCELFRKVCEAVSYAHRSLVIHRDLKPSNVLATGDGVPKLLDFGIARILTPDGTARSIDRTSTLHPLTPDFASPEQVRGEPETTATDVYALGAVLYSLLTGAKPHRLERYTPRDLEIAVCEREPLRPSAAAAPALRNGLAGDLDTILLTALRKQPQRRYRSVDEFSEDIRRYLHGLPVIAREDTWFYVTGKFLSRNKAGVAAAALVAASLVGGAVTAGWQAHRADRQRLIAESRRQEAERERERAENQARLAEMQRQRANREHAAAERERDAALRASAEAREHQRRAEERLVSVVDLSNLALLDVHNALESLPGAIEARKRIVTSTLSYLDKQARQSGDDPRVIDTLVGAYARLGDVQGSPSRPSLGDIEGAYASYTRALELAQRQKKLLPKSVDASRSLAEVHTRIGRAAAAMGRFPEALEHFRAGLETAESLVRAKPDSVQDRVSVCGINAEMAMLLAGMKPAESERYSRNGLAVCEKLAAEHPENEKVLENIAAAHSTLGRTLLASGSLEAAVGEYRQNAVIRERMLAARPGDSIRRRTLMLAYAHIGDVYGNPWYGNLGRPEEAAAYYAKAVEIAEAMAKADVRNGTAQADLATALMRQGLIVTSPGGVPASLAVLRRSAAITESLRGRSPKDLQLVHNLGSLYEYIGRRLVALGDSGAAMASYRHSLEISLAASASAPKDLALRAQIMADHRAIVELLAQNGDREGALGLARKNIATAEGWLKEMPGVALIRRLGPRGRKLLGDAHRKLARSPAATAEQRAGDLRDAREAYAESVRSWKELLATAPDPASVRESRETEAALSECEREVAAFTAAGH